MIAESMKESANHVLKTAETIGEDLESRDISIAHRIPGKQGAPKPVIVKFGRRVTKVEIMRKKKELKEKSPAISITRDWIPREPEKN